MKDKQNVVNNKSNNGEFDDLDRRRSLGRLAHMKKSPLFGPHSPRFQEEVRKYTEKFNEEPYI